MCWQTLVSQELLCGQKNLFSAQIKTLSEVFLRSANIGNSNNLFCCVFSSISLKRNPSSLKKHQLAFHCNRQTSNANSKCHGAENWWDVNVIFFLKVISPRKFPELSLKHHFCSSCGYNGDLEPTSVTDLSLKTPNRGKMQRHSSRSKNSPSLK